MEKLTSEVGRERISAAVENARAVARGEPCTPVAGRSFHLAGRDERRTSLDEFDPTRIRATVPVWELWNDALTAAYVAAGLEWDMGHCCLRVRKKSADNRLARAVRETDRLNGGILRSREAHDLPNN